MEHPHLIQTAKEVQALSKVLSKASIIAFDTEFIRESTYFPRLEILQVATKDEAWLVDIQAFRNTQKGKRSPGRMADTQALKPLIDVLQNPKILKIVHAAHGDQECLLSAMDMLATPIFDTAVGASLVGLGDNIGLGNLLKTVIGVEHPKGYARTNWAKRPLPTPVLQYALADVTDLVEVAETLFKDLDQNNRRDWALELSSKFAERSLYEVAPEEIAKRLAQSSKFNIRDYSVLLELVRWREGRMRELDVPKRWLADDGVLIDLAKVKPKSAEQLQGFRGLSNGESRMPQAAKVLKAIQLGIENQDELPLDLKKRATLQPSSNETRVIELLRVWLSVLSDEHQISSKHIVPPNSILPLVRLKPKTVEELKDSGLISPQLGSDGLEQIFQFLSGNIGLVIRSGKVRVQSMT